MDPDQFREQSETWFSFLKGFVDGFIVPIGKTIADFGQFLFNHPAWTIALIIGSIALGLLIKYAWKVGLVVLGVVLVLGVGWGMWRGDQTESISNQFGSNANDDISNAKAKPFSSPLFGSNANDDISNFSRPVYDRLFSDGVGLATEEPSKDFDELVREFSRLIGQTTPAGVSEEGGCSPSYFPAENDSFENGLRKMRELARRCDHEELFVFIKTEPTLLNRGHQWVRLSDVSTKTSVSLDYEKLGDILQRLAAGSIEHIAFVHNHPIAVFQGYSILAPPSVGDLGVLWMSTGLRIVEVSALFPNMVLPDPRKLAEFASRQMMIAVDGEGAWVASFEPSWVENFLEEVSRVSKNPKDHEQFMNKWLSVLKKETIQDHIVLPKGELNLTDEELAKEIDEDVKRMLKIIHQDTLYPVIKEIGQKFIKKTDELLLSRMCENKKEICNVIYKAGPGSWLSLRAEMIMLDAALSSALERLQQLYPAGMNAEVTALLQHGIVNMQVRRRVIQDFPGIKLRYLKFGEHL